MENLSLRLTTVGAVITIHAVLCQASYCGKLLTESDSRCGGRAAFDKLNRIISGKN